MKNIAEMLRKEGKTNTKLYKDIQQNDLGGNANLNNLEVDQLTPRQRNQLKTMKLSGDAERAVKDALSSKAAEKAAPKGPGQKKEKPFGGV